MEKEDKELIDHLAEKLQSHELPYQEGAWEQFVQYEQQKIACRSKRIIAPWLAAAAAVVVLAIGGVYFFQQQSTNDSITNKVTSTVLSPELPDQKSQQKHLSDNSNQNPSTNPSRNAHEATDHSMTQKLNGDPHLNDQSKTLTAATNVQALVHNNDKINRINRDQAGNQHIIKLAGSKNNDAAINRQPQNLLSGIDRLLPQANISIADKYKQQSLAPDLAKTQDQMINWQPEQVQKKDINRTNESGQTNEKAATDPSFNSRGYFDPDAPENAGNKWALGVMVIPAMGNDSKLNLGYGVSVGYRLSNRISVNSGVSYNELSGTRNEDNSQAVAGSGGRLLSSVDANVTGLNVPLELRYHVSQKIYVGAGVSALAVLSNKLERNYSVSQMQTSAFEAKNGHQLKPDEMKSIAATLTTKENIPEAQIDSKNFAGFMNFTFGFQQKLNKTKSLSIEPYISVPMSNNLSNQHIRLTDGGIRIKLGL